MSLSLQKIITITLSLFTIGLSGSAALAYLSPADVFTDLEIPEGTQEVAAPPVQSAPVFFRDGEIIEQSTIPAIDSTSTDSPFEEEVEIRIPSLPSPTDIDAETEAMLEELQEEEAALQDVVEENVVPAAPHKQKQSIPMAILDRIKFLGGGVILAGIAFAFFLKKKKKSAAQKALAETVKPEDTIPAPEKPQQVEEGSNRLEHALEAMEEQSEEKPQ